MMCLNSIPILLLSHKITIPSPQKVSIFQRQRSNTLELRAKTHSLTPSLSLQLYSFFTLSFLSPFTLHTLPLHSSVLLPTLFFYSCFYGYQQRLDAAAYDRKNRAAHGVHDPTIHS